MEARRCDCCNKYYDEHMQPDVLFARKNTGLTTMGGAGLPIMTSVAFHPCIMVNDRETSLDLCPECKRLLVANTCQELLPGAPAETTEKPRKTRRKKDAETEGESPH